MKKIISKFSILALVIALTIQYLPALANAPFVDMGSRATEITYLYNLGIVRGNDSVPPTATPFEPLNRAEAAALLVRARVQAPQNYPNGCDFDDISGNEWYANPVCDAEANGIVDGDGDGSKYVPARDVNYAEFFKMSLDAYGHPVNLPGDPWYAPYEDKIREYGLDQVLSNYQDPGAPIPRGDVFALMYYFERHERGEIVLGDGQMIDQPTPQPPTPIDIPSEIPPGEISLGEGEDDGLGNQSNLDLGMIFEGGSNVMTASAINCDNPCAWSNAGNWEGGQVPSAGVNVHIPANVDMILDVSPPDLAGLAVEGSLSFAPDNLNLTADYIFVSGLFQIGSESNPFVHNAVIELNGSNTGHNVMSNMMGGMGNRGLFAAMGGRIELHGNAPKTVWTKLDQNLPQGSNSLTVLEANDWKGGDQIVVAPTDFYGVAQTEKLQLASTSGNQLTTSNGIQNARWGVLQYATASGMSLTPDNSFVGPTASTPTVLDERAEVGNLSRNIVIQGADDALWQNQGYGAHTMIMGLDSVTRIDGVEFRRMGQAGIEGRYPIHWHRLSYSNTDLLGDATGHYLHNSTIHNSQNRCIVIHATNGLDIRDNICFDVRGHAIFFEDAVERRNVVDGNLVLKVRNPQQQNALKIHEFSNGAHDGGSSAVWATNPDNTVTNNAMADAEFFSLWLAFPEKAIGDSSGVAMRPNRLLFGNFDGNTMHSNGSRGLFIDLGPSGDDAGNVTSTQYVSTVDQGADTEAPYTNIRRFTIRGSNFSKNKLGQQWDLAGYSGFTEMTAANSESKFFSGVGDKGKIENSLIVGTSLNHTPSTDTRTKTAAAFATYHSTFDITDNLIVNFPLVEGSTSGFSASEDYYVRPVEMGHVRNSNNMLIASHAGFRSFVGHPEPMADSHAKGFQYFTFASALWDPNGQWGPAGNWNVYNVPFLTHNANCTTIQEALSDHPGAASCDGSYIGFNDFILNDSNEFYADFMAIAVTRYNESNRYDFGGGNVVDTWTVDGAQADWPLAHMRHFATRRGGHYFLDFPENGAPTTFNTAVTNMHTADDAFVLGVRYSGGADGVVYASTGGSNTHTYTEVGSREAVVDSAGQTYWQDNANNIIWIKVSVIHPSLGALAQSHTPTELNGDPIDPVKDDHVLYNEFNLRIRPAG